MKPQHVSEALPCHALRNVNVAAKVQSTHVLPLDAGDEPATAVDRRLSVLEQPPPWCPKSLKDTPLSADPAIKRLTELRRNSGRVSRRLSFSGFEFGFGRKNPRGCVSGKALEQAERSSACDKENLLTDFGQNVQGKRDSTQRCTAPTVPLPPLPENATRQAGTATSGTRKRGKSMVERGRYEKMPR